MSITTWLVATIHLLTLPLGLAAVILRGRALASLDRSTLSTVFTADNLWGLAAVLWIVTGLLRAFGGLEKGTVYYLTNPLFHVKLGLFALLFLVELWPMMILLKWRIRRRRGEGIDTARAAVLARVSYFEAGLVILIVFVATALVRGLAP